MSIFVGYVGAGHTCTDGPQDGARALSSWFMGAYKLLGARNDGIYNCREVRGSTTSLSLHAVWRAVDLGCQKGAAWAQKLADLLVKYSKELGIQCVIYARRIWSGAHPHEGWRPYSGLDSHETHLHVELSKAAAKDLTVARIVAVLTPAKGAGVPIISEEDPLAGEISKTNLVAIADAVLNADVIPNQNAPEGSANPNWSLRNMVSDIENTQDGHTALLREIAADIQRINGTAPAAPGASPGVPAIDYDKLAAKVAPLLAADLAKRLQS